MEVTLTCGQCGSAIAIYPSPKAKRALCPVCSSETTVSFDIDHEASVLKICPGCGHRTFYRQKDFNRKIGVILFVLAAILTPWTYGLSLVVLWLGDVCLHRKLPSVAVCYKCQGVFRGVKNIDSIPPFDHETNDRTAYGSEEKK